MHVMHPFHSYLQSANTASSKSTTQNTGKAVQCKGWKQPAEEPGHLPILYLHQVCQRLWVCLNSPTWITALLFCEWLCSHESVSGTIQKNLNNHFNTIWVLNFFSQVPSPQVSLNILISVFYTFCRFNLLLMVHFTHYKKKLSPLQLKKHKILRIC